MAEYLNERINSGLNQIQIPGNNSHPCIDSNNNLVNPEKELVKIVDLLGRETGFKANKPLIYIFSDGTVEKVIIVRE